MMESLTERLLALSPAAKIAILLVVVLQGIIQIYCIVDLIRRPAVTGGNKWIWAVVIVAAGLLGSMLYLGLGRAQGVVLDQDAGAGDDSTTRRAIDKLYGDKR